MHIGPLPTGAPLCEMSRVRHYAIQLVSDKTKLRPANPDQRHGINTQTTSARSWRQTELDSLKLGSVSSRHGTDKSRQLDDAMAPGTRIWSHVRGRYSRCLCNHSTQAPSRRRLASPTRIGPGISVNHYAAWPMSSSLLCPFGKKTRSCRQLSDGKSEAHDDPANGEE